MTLNTVPSFVAKPTLSQSFFCPVANFNSRMVTNDSVTSFEEFFFCLLCNERQSITFIAIVNNNKNL
jgi:hypothetical protein